MKFKELMKQKYMFKYYILAIISIMLLVFLMLQGPLVYDKYYYLVNFGFSVVYIILFVFDKDNLQKDVFIRKE